MASAPTPDHSRDGESKRIEIISILSVCCVVTTTLVALRVITRALIIRAFGIDDWVVVVAQVGSLRRWPRVGRVQDDID